MTPKTSQLASATVLVCSAVAGMGIDLPPNFYPFLNVGMLYCIFLRNWQEDA